jgi:co-chaperonin GroES (HSP10)
MKTLNNYFLIEAPKEKETIKSGILLNEQSQEYTVLVTPTDETEVSVGDRILVTETIESSGHVFTDRKNILGIL